MRYLSARDELALGEGAISAELEEILAPDDAGVPAIPVGEGTAAGVLQN